MDRNTQLENYAHVLVYVGVNLQKGQGLHITVPAEGVELARAVAKCAYEAGAPAVVVRFVDERLDELYACMSQQTTQLETLETEYAAMTALSERNFAFLRLYAPSFLEAIPGREGLYADWHDRTETLANTLRPHTMGHGWTCIACCPTERWARHVFPAMPADEALDKLWSLLLHMTRSDTMDPVEGWRIHSDGIVAQGAKLTAAQFDALHIIGPGTDLKVGLIPSHTWGGGRFTNCLGVPAVPNIPTEELATTPDRLRTEGVVSSVRPLVFQGEVVDHFRIRFQGGKAVEWSAERGQETLTRIMTHDENACRLGEVAIVPSGGLIGATNEIYYCTLLDENATCHLALGAGFPMYVGDAGRLELVNHSAVHVDFMIGNDALKIFGVQKDGGEVPVLLHGKWAI